MAEARRPTTASSPARSNTPSCCSTASASPRTRRRRRKFSRLAAARRNPIAQNRLAHLYLTGRGVPKDLVRAALWTGLAPRGGLKDDKLDKAIGALTPEQIKQVNELARQEAEF